MSEGVGPTLAEMALERDRTSVAECVTAIQGALNSYSWLITSRGSYEWNDDRWHKEFETACAAIQEALEPMIRIAGDWSNCPKNWRDVMAARKPSAEQRRSLVSLREAVQSVIKIFIERKEQLIRIANDEPDDTREQRARGRAQSYDEAEVLLQALIAEKLELPADTRKSQ